MDLTRHLGPEQILLGVTVKDKWQLLDRMIAALARNPVILRQPDEVRRRIGPAILERERQQSSGLADGLAYPHARVKDFHGFAACLAVLANEIDYETLDHAPVRLVFMAATPLETPMVGMQAMSLFATLMSKSEIRQFVLSARDPGLVHDYLAEHQPDTETVIVARHLMRPLRVLVNPDTPLSSVTRMMSERGIEAVPVVDAQGKLEGEITCDLLFKKGLPDFFSQLTNVAFIRYFDPFERYFEEEANAKARDVMSNDFAAIGEDATLMEIVYLFSVRHYPKLYVVRDGLVVGEIDRAAVMDRILNL